MKIIKEIRPSGKDELDALATRLNHARHSDVNQVNSWKCDGKASNFWSYNPGVAAYVQNRTREQKLACAKALRCLAAYIESSI